MTSYMVGDVVPYIAAPVTLGFTPSDHTCVWTFSDGTYASGLTANKAWATSGSKTATVVATNKYTGASATANKIISISNAVLSDPTTAGLATVDVAYGASVFAALVTDGVYTSPDGKVWTRRLVRSFYYDAIIAFVNNKFVITGSGFAATSSDGINWSTSTSIATLSGGGYNDIAYGGGVYVVAGPQNAYGPNIQTSTDGLVWTTRTSADLTSPLWGVAYGNGVFVACSGTLLGNGGNKYFMHSTDGITWTASDTTAITGSGSGIFERVFFWPAINKFVAVGFTYRNAAVSTDGITWTLNDALSLTGQYAYYDIVIGRSTLTRVGYQTGPLNLRLEETTDGLTWTSPSYLALGAISAQRMAYGNNAYVICNIATGYMKVLTFS